MKNKIPLRRTSKRKIVVQKGIRKSVKDKCNHCGFERREHTKDDVTVWVTECHGFVEEQKSEGKTQ